MVLESVSVKFSALYLVSKVSEKSGIGPPLKTDGSSKQSWSNNLTNQSFNTEFKYLYLCNYVTGSPSTHNYKYLEIPILIVWGVISQEGKQMFAWNLPQFYSYS